MKSVPDRIEYLRERVKAANESKNMRTYTVKWRNELVHFPVIKVETSFLRYRLKNGRTKIAQIKWLADHRSANPLLFTDPESDEAQKAQEEILRRMIEDAGLMRDLKRSGQREPAIITKDGYVLNGNRRLVALKEKGDEFMDCVVLPNDANEKELFDLEVELQMAEDTRADYDWICELLNIREGIDDHNEKPAELAARMGQKKSFVLAKIETLHLVDLYLDWIGQKGQYQLVDQAEQAFDEVQSHYRKIPDALKKEYRNQAFAMIICGPERGRKYGQLKKFANNFMAIQRNLIGRRKPTCSNGVSEPAAESSSEMNRGGEVGHDSADDPLTKIAEYQVSSHEEETHLFDDPISGRDHVNWLFEAIDDEDGKARDAEDRMAAYDSVSQAQRILSGVVIDSATIEIDGIYEKLREIIRRSTELSKRAQELRKREGG